MLRVYHYLIYAILGTAPVLWSFWPTLGGKWIYNSDFLGPLNIIPYFGFTLLGVMALRLNLTRVFLVSILFVISYVCLDRPELFRSWEMGRLSLSLICSLATPFSLFILFFGKETMPFSLKSLVKGSFLVAPFIGFASLFYFQRDFFVAVGQFNFYPIPGVRIPQLVFFPLALFIFFNWKKHKKIKLFINGLLVVLVPIYLSFNTAMSSALPAKVAAFQIALCMTVSSAILLHVMFNMYWQRVYIDELTEIPNRRAMDEYLQTLSKDYAIAMIDIDLFKKFNDDFGHYEGDNILRMVAAMLLRGLPGKVYRYGGEEFAVIFPGYSAQDCFAPLDKIREKVHGRRFVIRKDIEERHREGPTDRGKQPGVQKVVIHISISAGVADSLGKKYEYLKVMKLADKALYHAKANGRNQVVLYSAELKAKTGAKDEQLQAVRQG